MHRLFEANNNRVLIFLVDLDALFVSLLRRKMITHVYVIYL